MKSDQIAEKNVYRKIFGLPNIVRDPENCLARNLSLAIMIMILIFTYAYVYNSDRDIN